MKKNKKLMRKALIAASLFLLGSLAVSLYSLLVKRFGSVEWLHHPLMLVSIMTLISVLAFKPLDIAFTQLFKNYLFKKKSYGHIALMNLTEELALILDLQELGNLIVNTFGEVLHLKTVALVIGSRVRGDFEIASAYGWNVSDYRRVRLPEDSPLIQLIRSGGPHVLVRDRAIRTLAWQEANRLTHDFDSLRAGWVIPLFLKEDFIGAIAFSAQGDQRVFDEVDFHFFREFAAPVAKYIRNAMTVQELKIVNSELQDIQSQLIQSTKLTAIEQLATGIAHEIHNPLTIISGKAQVLLMQKKDQNLDQRVEEVLKTIVKQTTRAADITRKLLMFSQGSRAPKEPLSLGQTLEDTIALIAYQTSLEGIEITKSFGDGIPDFYANVHEMREVFLNLILNSVQSVGSHGKIHIELNYDSKDELLSVQISDTGRGIDKDHIDKLFNPFFTTRNDGVGLGLFVTKQIVHRYGGSIRAESRPGEGSLFIVQLPILGVSGYGEVPDRSSLTLFPGV
ncbi:MAG: ATP-binding protein [Candidatus Omnitrophota bacterium]|nr:ATP-binding protein [Candidatus Omnitrophota bacterium]